MSNFVNARNRIYPSDDCQKIFTLLKITISKLLTSASSSAILLLQARAKYCLWEVRFTVQIRTKTGFFTWHMSEYQLSKVIGLWLWEPNILPACTAYSSTEEHYLSCKKLCKKLLMAGLVLELIKFLPALSADSSTHRNVQRSCVMERGSEPWCRARWARAVRVRTATVQGDRHDLPSGTHSLVDGKAKKTHSSF